MTTTEKSITLRDSGSGRPIVQAIYDVNATSYTDSNINFAEVTECINDIDAVSSHDIFVRSFGEFYEPFMAEFSRAKELGVSVVNMSDILDTFGNMRDISLQAKPSAIVSFVSTQLKPFIKPGRTFTN